MRAVIALAVLLLLVTYSQAKELNLVIVGSHQKTVGSIVLAKLYERIGVKVRFESLPAKRAQYLVRNGLKDGEALRVASYSINNPTMIKVPHPIYYLETTAFVRKDSNIAANGLANLSPYKLVVLRGAKHHIKLTSKLKKVHTVNDVKTMMTLVESGRADIAVTSLGLGKRSLNELQLDTVEAIAPPLNRQPLYHFLHPSKAHYVPLLSQTIMSMTQNGELERIINSAQNEVWGE